jgi:hypothetical protein
MLQAQVSSIGLSYPHIFHRRYNNELSITYSHFLRKEAKLKPVTTQSFVWPLSASDLIDPLLLKVDNRTWSYRSFEDSAATKILDLKGKKGESIN